MQFQIVGSAAASGIPVFGCDCAVCSAAQQQPELRRQKTSALIKIKDKTLLIDANADNFLTRFPAGSFEAIALTHFHMDHVMALFDIRWGCGAKIPVYMPNERHGADDLFKHSGILDFTVKEPFVPFEWHGITITPVPLTHSRVCHGYVFDYAGKRLAYLTDSAWLPEPTLEWLTQQPIDQLFLDTSAVEDDSSATRNHHSIFQARKLYEYLQPQKMGLVHLTHEVLLWAHDNPSYFDASFYLAKDGEVVNLE